MKIVSSTLVLATFCCASAFGLHGTGTTSAVKTLGAFAKSRQPMVQAVDIHGQRASTMVSLLCFVFFA